MNKMFKGIKTDYGDEEFFFIKASGDGVILFVEPANRFNGTQNYDGYFPRYYSHTRYAKAALTRSLGKPNDWQEI
jgi:hypothetical protein